jgi:hypothetical protein
MGDDQLRAVAVLEVPDVLREQAREPVFRPHTWVSDFNDTVNYFRRCYDEHPAA